MFPGQIGFLTPGTEIFYQKVIIELGADLTINLMYPDHGKDFILSLGNGSQKFTKDYGVNRDSLHTGFFFRDHPILNKFGDESFILGGVNLKKSEREILTNTTSSGKLSITDNFETYDLIIGTKINNDFIIVIICYKYNK